MSLSLYYFVNLTAVHILMTWSLYLPYRLRRLHFMVIANMGIAAYAAGYLTTVAGWPFGTILPLGALLGATTALLIVPVTADAPPFTVAIVGLTLISLTTLLIENSEIFGGTLGLFGIPSIHRDPSAGRLLLLAVTWLCVLAVAAGIAVFERSRWGIAASIAFVDRDLAESNAVNVRQLSFFVQLAGSTIAGIAGVLYAFTMRGLFPGFFSFRYLGVLMTILFVGGYTTPWGPFLVAPLVWGIPLLLPEGLQSWRIVLYAVALIAVLMLRPEGLVTRDLLRRITALLRRPQKSP